MEMTNQYSNQPLRDIATIRGGGTPPKSNPYYWSGQIPWITPKDMKARQISDSIDHITKAAVQETAAKLIEPGAVVVVVRGMILAHTFPSAVLRVRAAINQDMKALIPNGEIDAEFLCSYLWATNATIIDLVEKSTHDTRKLETEKLLAIPIPLPPIPEQRCIVAELDRLQARVFELRTAQANSRAELRAFLGSVLDRAFSGRL
jgi:type I restriction enzyme S subunit